jgi:hypothetical protein
LSDLACSSTFEQIVANKTSEEAKKVTQENISLFQTFFKSVLVNYSVPFSLYSSDRFPCLTQY